MLGAIPIFFFSYNNALQLSIEQFIACLKVVINFSTISLTYIMLKKLSFFARESSEIFLIKKMLVVLLTLHVLLTEISLSGSFDLEFFYNILCKTTLFCCVNICF